MSATMEVLKSRFRDSLATDADALVAALACGDWVEAERLVHNLAGAAGLFGLPALGERAGVLDEAFVAGEASPDDVRALAEAMRRAAYS
jgi:HPt (histidine-containing phosphotransfer) domain-containing protein